MTNARRDDGRSRKTIAHFENPRYVHRADSSFGAQHSVNGSNIFDMTFHITHRNGEMDSDPPLSSLPTLVRELDERSEDTEHDSVAVTHESEWCISISRGRHVVFEHLEEGGERHMCDVPDEKIIDLCSKLARGDLAGIVTEPWQPGYS
jgi:putative hemolysin